MFNSLILRRIGLFYVRLFCDSGRDTHCRKMAADGVQSVPWAAILGVAVPRSVARSSYIHRSGSRRGWVKWDE